jgi:hypothetical protein
MRREKRLSEAASLTCDDHVDLSTTRCVWKSSVKEKMLLARSKYFAMKFQQQKQ